jgi:hypothetical protein
MAVRLDPKAVDEALLAEKLRVLQGWSDGAGLDDCGVHGGHLRT